MAMAPARYAREPGRYEPMRANLNQTLAFAGPVVDDAGNLTSAARATTLPEAQRRALHLRRDLEEREVHPDVLAFCRAELLPDNFFHAVQEAVKSVAAKLRARMPSPSARTSRAKRSVPTSSILGSRSVRDKAAVPA